MKLKKTILGLAVVAVAGVNVWKAADVITAKNDLSLLSLENIADASDVSVVINGDTYYYGFAAYWVYQGRCEKRSDGHYYYYYKCVEHVNQGKWYCTPGEYTWSTNPNL